MSDPEDDDTVVDARVHPAIKIDSARAVLMRETAARRDVSAAVTRPPKAHLVRIAWARSTAPGLDVRVRAPDRVVFSGSAHGAGRVSVAIGSEQWSIDVGLEDPSIRVARRLKQRVIKAFELDLERDGTSIVAFFRCAAFDTSD